VPISLAVADGHGSPASFRSEVGSRLAANIAAEAMIDFLRGFEKSPILQVKRTAEDRLPREITRLWTKQVRVHLASEPFSDAECKGVEAQGGAGALQKLEQNPLLAYGTTALVAGAMETCIVLLQVGDGDVLTVSAQGETLRPLPPDDRVFADETPSLCLPDAWRDYRCAFHSISGTPPGLILLSTDGYSNCYSTDADFLKSGSDFLEMIRARGTQQVQEDLPHLLTEATDKYSGDDITVGIIWFQETPEKGCEEP
jgi:serine/threonine protein phosphatase PrpC